MRTMSLFRIAGLAAFLLAWQGFAQAQTAATPQQLQAMIANGQPKAALNDLQGVLRAHPHSGVAWYLVAEAQDASGNRPAARSALAKAESYAPGLPFAKPASVAALKAHLAGPAIRHRSGVSPVVIIGGLVILFILIRLFFRSRRVPPNYQAGYGPGSPAGPPAGPYGPSGGMPYGPGAYGQGPYGPGVGAPRSGIGSAIVGGLAAGAGVAAGERLIDGLTGPREGPVDQGFSNDPAASPDRDDGLQGSPDWGGDNSGDTSGGGFDTDDQW